jgi:hypothetical protein
MKDRSPSLGDKLDCLQLEAPKSVSKSLKSVSAPERLQLVALESVSAPESLQLATPESSHLLPAKQWFIFIKVCLCFFCFFTYLGWVGWDSHIWVGLGYILNFFFYDHRPWGT